MMPFKKTATSLPCVRSAAMSGARSAFGNAQVSDHVARSDGPQRDHTAALGGVDGLEGARGKVVGRGSERPHVYTLFFYHPENPISKRTEFGISPFPGFDGGDARPYNLFGITI